MIQQQLIRSGMLSRQSLEYICEYKANQFENKEEACLDMHLDWESSRNYVLLAVL